MKVLASLKPYYYYLVGEGKKKIEVRKSEPKAKDWDRDVLFYMSKDEKSFAKIPKELQEKYRKHFGKVGLEFVCDEIKPAYEWTEEDFKATCVSKEEYIEYAGKSRSNQIYGWHISNLKIYDKPKELFDFNSYSKYQICKERNCFSGDCWTCPNNAIMVSPPQSWCYVEE